VQSGSRAVASVVEEDKLARAALIRNDSKVLSWVSYCTMRKDIN